MPTIKPTRTRHSRRDVDWFVHEHLFLEDESLAVALVKKFGFSRQAANAHIKRLLDAGAISTKGDKKEKVYDVVLRPVGEFTCPLEGLEEDVLWNDRIAKHVAAFKQNVKSILFYGFTEMVNNAIDHSEGRSLHVVIYETFAAFMILIIDDGVGIFKKIKDACDLPEEHHALLELAKGKLTTAQEKHSGEGIFFTSRACDRFSISSGQLALVHFGDTGADVLLPKDEPSPGTKVRLWVHLECNRTLEEVFDKYTSGEDPSFSKTLVPVKLASYQGEGLVSRSQAKRLLARFDRFQEILLDFEGVSTIGQGFADEVFRVFTNAHPEIHIIPIRMNPAVKKMVHHVLDGAAPRSQSPPEPSPPPQAAPSAKRPQGKKAPAVRKNS